MTDIKDNELCYRLIDLLYESVMSRFPESQDDLCAVELILSDLARPHRDNLTSVRIEVRRHFYDEGYELSINGNNSWTISHCRRILFDLIKDQIECTELLGRVIVADESFINPLINKIQMTLQAIKL